MVLEYSRRQPLKLTLLGIAGEGSRSMRRITPTEAHRKHMVHGKEKKERAFPLAGDTDNDATYHEEEAEAPSAGPPVSSSEIQTHVPSFFEPTPASAADVASQLLRLTNADILDFTSSRNTLHYQPILSKLLLMETSLATRFDAIRLVDIAAAAAPPRVQSQMLLSPLPSPQQMPARTEEQPLSRTDDDTILRPIEATAAAPVEEAGQPVGQPMRKVGGQPGKKQRGLEPTRASTRTAAAASSPPPPKRRCDRHGMPNPRTIARVTLAYEPPPRPKPG